MVPRTKGVRDRGPIAPNSKTWVRFGVYSLSASMATTCGMPQPTKTVFRSSSRRAARQIMHSVSVNRAMVSVTGDPAGSLRVSLFDGPPSDHVRQPSPPHLLLQQFGVGPHAVHEGLEIRLHLFLSLDRVQLLDLLEVQLVFAGHSAWICPERKVHDGADQEVGDRRLCRLLPKLERIDDLLGRDDDLFRGHGRLERKEVRP